MITVRRANAARLEHVMDAIRYLEPACAAAGAGGTDREQTIVPRRRAIIGALKSSWSAHVASQGGGAASPRHFDAVRKAGGR